ncbi:hypothetical protein OIO90_001136 [Microbotryomycetes sp. JL221]|nr:hypothetical protein OIO90_001136 [Microbotryomycetes sp. JL221]
MVVGPSSVLEQTSKPAGYRIVHSAATPVPATGQSDLVASSTKALSSKGKQREHESVSDDAINSVNTQQDIIQLLKRPRRHRQNIVFFDNLRQQIVRLGLLTNQTIIRLLATTAIKHGHNLFALSLIRQSKLAVARLAPALQPSVQADLIRTFESATSLLCSLHKWHHVVSLTDLVANLTSPTSMWTLYLIKSRMRAMYHSQRFLDCIDTFHLFTQSNIEPDGDGFDDLIGAHLLAGHLEQAQIILEQKQRLGFPTTTRTVLNLIDGMWLYGGNKPMEDKVLYECSQQDLRNGQALSQDVRVLHRIMSVRASRGMYEDALDVLTFFQLDGTTNLGRTVKRLCSTQLVTKLESTQSTAFRPRVDVNTIVILIGISSRLDQFDVAKQLFVDGVKFGLNLNDNVVTAYIKVLITEGQVEDAVKFFNQLTKGEATVYDSNARCHIKLPVFQRSRSKLINETLFSAILAQRGPARATQFLADVAATPDHSQAEHTYLSRSERGPILTQGMLSSLVDWVTRHRQLGSKATAQLVTRMYEMTTGSMNVTMKDYNRLLAVAWREETKLRQTIQGKKRDLPLSDKASQAMSNHVVEQGFVPDRTTMLNELRLRSSMIDGATAQFQHPRQTPAELWDFVQTSLIDRGMRPTARHMTTIILAYIQLGDGVGAEKVLDKALTLLDVKPHVSMFTALINGLSKLGHKDRAFRVYRRMKLEFLSNNRPVMKSSTKVSDLKPDRQLFATLCMLCVRQRDVEGVEFVWDEAEKVLESSSTLSSSQPPVKLDPIFVSIMYRALSMDDQIEKAQQMINSKLDQSGFVPDRVLLKVLDRTTRWAKAKLNGQQASNQIRANVPRRRQWTLSELQQIKVESEQLLLRAKQVLSKYELEKFGQTGPRGRKAAALREVKKIMSAAGPVESST